MELGIRKYTIGIFICLAIVCALAMGAAYLWYPEAFGWKVPVLALVFFAVSVLGILMLDRYSKKGDRTLVSGYMAVKGVRMVILVGVLLVFLLIDRHSVKWIAAAFVLFYIAMPAFDTFYFSKKFKK
ncbi:MAG: hypothetical protein IJG54_01245 [Bacteroidales bacterium]|nr:hypothetical protein [Bacteroidales bacterium]